MGCHSLVTPCPPTPSKATAAPALTAAPQRVALPVSGFAAPAIASSLGSRERGHGAEEGLARACAWPQRWCKDDGPPPCMCSAPAPPPQLHGQGVGSWGPGSPPCMQPLGSIRGTGPHVHACTWKVCTAHGCRCTWTRKTRTGHCSRHGRRWKHGNACGTGTAALACTAGG